MAEQEAVCIDVIIDRALSLSGTLPASYTAMVSRIRDLHSRLANGELHLAVLGQFNRGKSTFLNALTGCRLLPVSVLPLTSVPTVIRHGDNLSCTVRLTDGSAVEKSGPDDIRQLLAGYVTEEGNPNNRKGVVEATVRCPGEILGNGTVLIDTPGFGSTFLHNTRTTAALLEQCDAALFLLSADLPITEVELDFLRQVRPFVAHLFFIYNKVDLLTPEEIDRTQRFIADVLVRQAGFEPGVRLFPVCARAAQNREVGEPDPSAWEKSGMAAIKSGVIDFLHREKYFTLSRALIGKLFDALDRIVALLRSRLGELEQPALRLAERIEATRRGLESYRASAEPFAAALRDWKQRAGLAVGELVERVRAGAQGRLAETVTAVSASAITFNAARLIDETAARFLAETTRVFAAEAETLVRVLVLGLERIVCGMPTVAEGASDTIPDAGRVRQRLESAAASGALPQVGKPELPADAVSAGMRIRGVFGKNRAVLELLLPLFAVHADRWFATAGQAVLERIDRLYDAAAEITREQLERVSGDLTQQIGRQQSQYEEAVFSAKDEADCIRSLIDGFSRMRSELAL